jgi:arylformamidase
LSRDKGFKVHDISQSVAQSTAVWPGDQPFELGWTLRRDRGDSVNVAAAHLSVHTGTHADGPYHVNDSGHRPAQLPLDAYLGRAIVVDAVGCSVLDVDAVRTIDVTRAERVLFRTRATVDAGEFPPQFAAIAPALARKLVDAGVRLVGTDAPSVDPADSKTLETHRILAEADVAILENLVLCDIAPGRYTLIALPLKLEEADSSPVRAVLIEGSLND